MILELETITDIDLCVEELAVQQRNMRTAIAGSHAESICTSIEVRMQQLLQRYWQLGGTALQIGDLITQEGQVRSPEDQHQCIQQTQQALANR